MKKAPCIRLGMRSRPKMSENPDESRNSRPPSAILFTAKVSQTLIGRMRVPCPLTARGWGWGEADSTRELLPPLMTPHIGLKMRPRHDGNGGTQASRTAPSMRGARGVNSREQEY